MANNLKTKLDFKNFSLAGLLKNISWLFLALFLVLLVFEVFEIRTSVGLALEVNQTPQVTVPTSNRLDRIDFNTYQQNLQRVQNAQTYQAPGGITYDPFNGLGAPPGQPITVPTSTLPSLATSTTAGISTASSTLAH